MPPASEAQKLKAGETIRRAALLGRIGRSAEAEAALVAVDFSVLTDPKEPKSKDMLARDRPRPRRHRDGRGARRRGRGPPEERGRGKQEKGFEGSDDYPNSMFSRLALATSLDASAGRTRPACTRAAPREELALLPGAAVARARPRPAPPAPIASTVRAESASLKP